MSSADAVCPSCGASYRNAGGSRTQQVAYVKELPTGKRPGLASAFVGLSVIGAIGAFLLAGSYKFIPSMGVFNSLASSFSSLAGAMPYLLGVVGIISLVAAFGFFKGNRWAWRVGLLASLLEILTIIAPNPLGLLVGIISLYFLTTRPVKAWLRN